MSIPLEVTIKYDGKTIYGHAEVDAIEFEQLKKQDRWDLERYLRQILADLGHGITNQIYIHDAETIQESIKGKVDEILSYIPENGVLDPSSEEVTRLISSLPLLTHNNSLIGDPDGTHKG